MNGIDVHVNLAIMKQACRDQEAYYIAKDASYTIEVLEGGVSI